MTPTDWVPLVNASGGPVPSFGLVVSTGMDADGNLQVVAPTADNAAGVIVLGPGAMPAAGHGQGTLDNRVIVAYDERDGAPAAGATTWGVKSGDFRLRSGYTGFRILGGASGGLVNAARVSAASAASFSLLSSSNNASISSDSTWADLSGAVPELTLPSAGKYLLHYNLYWAANVSATPGSASMGFRLYNVTTTFVKAIRVVFGSLAATGFSYTGNIVIDIPVETAGAEVIRVEGKRSAGPTWTSAALTAPVLDGGGVAGHQYGYTKIS